MHKKYLQYVVHVMFFLYFCSVKRNVVILILSCFLLAALSGCQNLSSEAKSLQRTLHQQQRYADELVLHLSQAIETNNFESIQLYANNDENVLCYIYKGRQLVFWSNSWLSASDRSIRQIYNQWHFVQWDNAQGVCYRTQVGEFQIVVAIPVKYDYSVTNSLLHNYFITPFRGKEDRRLTFHKGGDNSVPLFSYDGQYLFSLVNTSKEPERKRNTEIIENFSYQAILAVDQQEQAAAKDKLRMYYVITGATIGMLFFIAIFSLIKYRGFRRMRLGGKFQLVLTPLVLVILLSIFLLSVEYIGRLFVETQQLRLSKKAKYVQMALQNMYFWDMNLSPANTMALNIDLRDMVDDSDWDGGILMFTI